VIRKIALPYLAATALAFFTTPVAIASQAIELAIVPYLPARTILERYKPLRDHLERKLGQPVMLFTAPDYQTFITRTQKHEYPFVVTVAHAARLAEREAGYVPMLRPALDTRALFMVARGSPVNDVADLRTKRVAVPDRMAIVTQLGMQVMREHGLKPDEDVTLVPSATHVTAMHAVLAGEADAAVVSDRAFIAADSNLKQGLRTIATSGSGVPGVVFLASPMVPPALVATITQAIMDFANETPEGKQFLQALGYDTLRRVKANELATLDAFVPPLQKLLHQTQP